MNSDKFDRIVLDLLYGELDELTTAAAKRHMEQSARAREIYLHLKATRQLGVLPTHSPPLNFELELMERERGALAELPVYHRIGRIVSMLAGYAMRPQLIMGALLLLMIGSSLMFLRTRPGQHSAVMVTERGAPEADVDLVLPVPAAAASVPPVQAHGIFQSPTPAENGASASKPTEAARLAVGGPAENAGSDATLEGLDPFDQAIRMYREGQYVEAQRRFERISRAGGLRAAEAALYSAQAVRNVSGCAAAVSRFDRVRLRFPGSGSAYEAAWRAAKCLLQLGDVEAARQNYESLLQVASHGERARTALAALSGATSPVTNENGAPIDEPTIGALPRAASNAAAAPALRHDNHARPSRDETAPATEQPRATERGVRVSPEPGREEADGGAAPRGTP